MAVPSVTEKQLATAVRAFIVGVLPSGVPVLQGQQNKLAQPVKDSVFFTHRTRRRLSTEAVTWDYESPSASMLNRSASFEVIYQIDAYGPFSADNAQVLLSLFRSSYACDRFNALVPTGAIQPLYSTDPLQMPLVAGEDQYEDRWTMDLHVQANIQIDTSQDMASELEVEGIIMADREIT